MLGLLAVLVPRLGHDAELGSGLAVGALVNMNTRTEGVAVYVAIRRLSLLIWCLLRFLENYREAR